MSLTKVICTVIATLVLSGCEMDNQRQVTQSNIEANMTYQNINDIPKEKLAALAERSFFFAHQSVGRNMLSGLNLLMSEIPDIKINITESENPALLKPGTLMHSNVGKNGAPQTKLDAFVSALDNGLGNKVDAAFLKYCYADLRSWDNPHAMFESYKQEASNLKTKHPNTQIIHFTVPIKTVEAPEGLKDWVKRILGKPIPNELDNIIRWTFNELIRKEYGGKEPIFDIARIESIDPKTGEQHYFMHEGNRIEVMALPNTYDGGHLTPEGERWVAGQFISFLANLEYR